MRKIILSFLLVFSLSLQCFSNDGSFTSLRLLAKDIYSKKENKYISMDKELLVFEQGGTYKINYELYNHSAKDVHLKASFPVKTTMKFFVSRSKSKAAEIFSYKPPYKPNRTVIEYTTTREEIFYRVHGEGNKARSWMLKAKDIKGFSVSQIKDKFALPNTPTYISKVYVPKGTRIRMGIVNPNFGGKGGGIQYELLKKLSKDCFRETKTLK